MPKAPVKLKCCVRLCVKSVNHQSVFAQSFFLIVSTVTDGDTQLSAHMLQPGVGRLAVLSLVGGGGKTVARVSNNRVTHRHVLHYAPQVESVCVNSQNSSARFCLVSVLMLSQFCFSRFVVAVKDDAGSSRLLRTD